ncbi:peptidase M23 [Bacillus solimangrovi]|uniref:Peptidase M23 n=1 Tax=Bacillus solimangrovi TaxID=1305675 RepID=A0A1E5LIT5_9BACI|nr:M23 family metallopeptidase [Bacillus solimangrovi]OEH93966.1 peptidase M23 [Bacillus solimangrovi]
MKKIAICLIVFVIYSVPLTVSATTDYEGRQHLYSKMETITQIPWYYFAAVDQYERNIRNARKDLPDTETLIGIYFSPQQWVGPLNPDIIDNDPLSIEIFNGIGLDGNGDGKADRTNDEDVIYTMAMYLSSYGTDKENLKIALWDYYKRDKTVNFIMNYARIYEKYGVNLDKHAFPLPLHANYSYRSTWGDRRGWGGLRIHEGTDLFAGYGVPVKATGYGFVEMKGWNEYGGWRIGIRDINNVYHYLAHLRGFEKGIDVGSIVEPGTIIGYVGSSGYGPPGTQGKFPPHLHYGMYKDNGITEWSFDPYPYLRAWERKERIERKKK